MQALFAPPPHPISNVKWLLVGVKFDEAGARNRCNADPGLDPPNGR